MSDKSVPDQIINGFIDAILKKQIIDEETIKRLKVVLQADSPEKADILNAIKGGE